MSATPRTTQETKRNGTPAGTAEILRSLEMRMSLLRARGLPLPELEMGDAYAQFLAQTALLLSPAPDGETGYDARDSDGHRYRILGRRLVDDGADVVVPGIPDRSFDRIVAVRFGKGYGVIGARMSPAVPFLHRADYREATNEWSLSLEDDFWEGEKVEDLTPLLRAAAAEAGQTGTRGPTMPELPPSYVRRAERKQVSPRA